jgi:hypothetical protein
MHQDCGIDLQGGEHVIEHRDDYDAATNAKEACDDPGDKAGRKQRTRQQGERNKTEIFHVGSLSYFSADIGDRN